MPRNVGRNSRSMPKLGSLAGFGLGMVAVALMSPIPQIWQTLATAFFALATLALVAWSMGSRLRHWRAGKSDVHRSWWSFFI